MTRAPAQPDHAEAVLLRAIYEDVLGAGHVDEGEGFFVLGGSSLLVEILLERVRARFGVTVAVERFYAEPTLAGLRRLVQPPSAPDPDRPGLAGLLARAAAPDPTRPAVVGPDGALSYAEAAALTERAAARAAEPPAPRAVRLPTTVDGVRTVLADLAAGVPVLVLDPAATAAEEAAAREAFDGELRAGGRLAGAGPVHGLATSGSTGRPKVVLSPTDGTLLVRLRQAEDVGMVPGDVYLVTAPLHLSFGLGGGLLAGLLGGVTVVLPPLPLTPDGLRRAAEEQPPTLTMGVGLAYRFLLAAGARLPALRRAVIGGEPLPPGLDSVWEERTGVPLTDSYGTSETGHVSTNVEGVAGSVGRPLPGVEVRLTGEHDAPGGTGAGELLVRSPGLARGYAGDPELTADRFRDGWFATGDLAEVREDGHLLLRGRLDDQLNVGGSKVDPREVEAACRESLGLTDCAVEGIALESGRTEVCAYVVADHPVRRADLVAALRDRLSAHKIPTRVVQLDALPRGAGGKIRRADLPR
ncbi:class I adenylate-forming enzyme family protein [Blastococcus saxobsidens]|uniref:class I adenylate-forming enzyme family protein n=1 Tax=Blastococcus saxobsidens TaxID=138336 RepID=UPI00140FA407|nr:fatty acid--CoA ligase family protein [Blastococcus saxobsidens]